MKTVPWQNLENLYKGSTLRNLNYKILKDTSWRKRLREPKFKLSRSYSLGCRWGTNFCQRRRWQKDKYKLLFSRFMNFYRISEKKNKIFGMKPILSIYFMMKVKNLCSIFQLSWSFGGWRNRRQTNRPTNG
jgi:hypothetical protein